MRKEQLSPYIIELDRTKGRNHFHVYIIHLQDFKIYCGSTGSLISRLHQHLHGKGSKPTQSDRPFKLLGLYKFDNRFDALNCEHEFWKRIKTSPGKVAQECRRKFGTRKPLKVPLCQGKCTPRT